MAIRPRHVRHRAFERLRHSDRFKSWIADKAVELGVTEEEVFELLKQYTFEQLTEDVLPEDETPPEE